MSILPSNYIDTLAQIKKVIINTHYQVTKSVSCHLFDMYWLIGQKLTNEAKDKWGQNVVQKLSQDIQAEFNGVRGFSTQNLWLMKQMYQEYYDYPKLQQLAREVSWTSNAVIIQKIKDPKEREYYLQKTKVEIWSRAILKEKINKDDYKNQNLAQNNFDKFPTLSDQKYIWNIKDEYHFDFLELDEKHTERQLEDSIVKNITKTLGQFGKDFSFMGRQFKLEASDKEFFVDLLFYHRKLKCLIAIELKTVEFDQSHTQQLNWYLHLLDKQVKYEDDNPSIGILICRDKDRVIVEYALEIATNPIGVAAYTFNSLPKEIAKYLPSEQDLISLFNDNNNQD